MSGNIEIGETLSYDYVVSHDTKSGLISPGSCVPIDAFRTFVHLHGPRGLGRSYQLELSFPNPQIFAKASSQHLIRVNYYSLIVLVLSFVVTSLLSPKMFPVSNFGGGDELLTYIISANLASAN